MRLAAAAQARPVMVVVLVVRAAAWVWCGLRQLADLIGPERQEDSPKWTRARV